MSESTNETIHPDFFKVKELVNDYLKRQNSNSSDKDDHYTEMLEGRADLEALVAASLMRAAAIHPKNQQLQELLSAMWLEGFCIGLKF